MRYTPSAISEADLQTALTPELGSDSQAYASFEPWKLVGDINQPLEDSGTLTMNSGVSLGAGMDLQMISTNGARSTEEIAITMGVQFDDNTVGTATATFSVPERSKNQSYFIPQSAAVDIIGNAAGAAKKIKAISGITAVAGGDANNKFMIVALPADDTYSLIGCVGQDDLKLPVPKSVPIACRKNASAFIAKGRGEVGTLTIKQKYVDYMDGLGRLNGHFATIRIDVLKDDRVLTERTVVGRFLGSASPSRGDGDDNVETTSEGMFQEVAIFVAP